jgi:hypothetical protein
MTTTKAAGRRVNGPDPDPLADCRCSLVTSVHGGRTTHRAGTCAALRKPTGKETKR